MADSWFAAWRSLFEPDHHLSLGRPVCPRFAWLDLCQMGTHETRDVSYGHDLIHLKPGELVVSVRTLADRWKWSKSAVSRFLGTLEKRDSIVAVSGTPAGTVYRIVNAADRWPGWGEGRDTPGTPTGTGGGQDADKNKKVKKDEADASSNWVSAAVDLWSDKAGKPNAGRIGKALKPLVEQYNEAIVLKVLAFYLDTEEPEYLKVERLAETFVKWGTKAKEASGGKTQRNGKRGAPPTWGYGNATERFEGFNEPDDDSDAVQGRGAA